MFLFKLMKHNFIFIKIVRVIKEGRLNEVLLYYLTLTSSIDYTNFHDFIELFYKFPVTNFEM